MIRAVVFDMDGLLLDTEKLLIKFWIQAANEAGFPMTRETALSLRSLHRSFAIPLLKETFGDDFDYLKIRARRMELMSDYLSKNPLELKKGAVELSEYLRENGITAAVCTATDSVRAEDYLKRAGIYGYFTDIVCAANVEKGKPMPDIYLYCAEKLGVNPSECIALEDSPNGVRSASSAGFKTIMVPDLSEPDEELMRLLYAKAESLSEVIEIIKTFKNTTVKKANPIFP